MIVMAILEIFMPQHMHQSHIVFGLQWHICEALNGPHSKFLTCLSVKF